MRIITRDIVGAVIVSRDGEILHGKQKKPQYAQRVFTISESRFPKMLQKLLFKLPMILPNAGGLRSAN